MPINPKLIGRLLPDTAILSKDQGISIANHAVSDLAQRYGTPLFIFDRATIINTCASYRDAFTSFYHASTVQFLYASKAYLSPLIARLMAEQGMGLDVVSGGELMVAQRANFPMEHVSFHGNNKSEEELRLALKLGVGRIVLDNWHELHRLTRLADDVQTHPKVLLRVAPDVETDTHRYLQTGHASSKFGFPLSNGEAQEALRQTLREGKLHVVGLHAHTGTMLRETRPYQECLERLMELAGSQYAESGWWPEEVSPGGGWAIDTVETLEAPDTLETPGIERLAQALQESMERALAALGNKVLAPKLVIEPGRSIIARAGVTVYRIGARKPTPGGITYLFVDGGMADNIRPALYGARYTALAVEQALAPAQETVCISGRYCESGDMLIEAIELPSMREGDLLLLPTTGAYCLPMASNYNLVPRPAVILLDDQRVQVMERRETYDDLLTRYQSL